MQQTTLLKAVGQFTVQATFGMKMAKGNATNKANKNMNRCGTEKESQF